MLINGKTGKFYTIMASFLKSSIGKKFIQSVSGAFLVLFLILHGTINFFSVVDSLKGQFGNVAIDRAKLNFYAGPGFTAGYVHDGERSVISHEHLVNHPGVICALSGTAGCLFTFGRHIALDLFLQTEVGFHISKDEFLEQNDLTFYSNGLTRAWIPHLLILYKF